MEDNDDVKIHRIPGNTTQKQKHSNTLLAYEHIRLCIMSHAEGISYKMQNRNQSMNS